MSRKVKKVFRVIWAWQEEKEEKWLEEMAAKGWFLESYIPCIYTFVSGRPGKYVYKFDYKYTTNKDFQDYIQIFQDAGWEYVTQFGNWHYFRKLDDGITLTDIFSDNESKIQKYKALLNFIGVFFAINLFNAINITFFQHIDEPGAIGTISMIKGLVILVTVLLGYGCLKIWRKIGNLKTKI